MKYRVLHDWDVTPKEAARIQGELAGMIRPVWDGGKVETLAAADVGFPDRQTVRTAVVVVTYHGLEILETRVTTRPCTFPYVPGLLAFREAPGLLSALEKLKTEPDILLCDGQGIAHRKRMGLGAHIGLLIDRPVIGCAKSVLYGTFEEPAEVKGSISYMHDREGGVIGAAVRTRAGVKPVYVSVGNRIDLGKAVEVVLGCSPRYRIPEPLRVAHKLSVGEKASSSAA